MEFCLPGRAHAPWPDMASPAADPRRHLIAAGFNIPPFHILSVAHLLDSYVELSKNGKIISNTRIVQSAFS